VETLVVKYDGDPYVANILVRPFLVSLLPQMAIVGGGVLVLLFIFIVIKKVRQLL